MRVVRLQASDSHHPLALATDTRTQLHDIGLLDTACLVRILCDLEGLRRLIEPSCRSWFYTESFSLLNHLETS